MAARKSGFFPINGPGQYLFRMFVFLGVAGFVVFLLKDPLLQSIAANPPLNLGIIAVLLFGILYTIGQSVSLWPLAFWTRRFRDGARPRRAPGLLQPLANMVGNARDEAVEPLVARSVLDSIGSRLDESREISRYMVGLLIFLGLLGTFWGLLQTINAVGDTIRSLSVGAGPVEQTFEELRAGLEAPLSGMGTAFSSSLIGLSGSLILGFLDLQMAQAQNRYYNDLEDWLSSTVASGSMAGLYGLGVSEDFTGAGGFAEDLDERQIRAQIAELKDALKQKHSNRRRA